MNDKKELEKTELEKVNGGGNAIYGNVNPDDLESIEPKLPTDSAPSYVPHKDGMTD